MLFFLFYFFAFLCVRNVVLKGKFWVENFMLFKLCYFCVIIYEVCSSNILAKKEKAINTFSQTRSCDIL